MPREQNDVKTKTENKQAIFRYILNHGSATKQLLFTDLGLSLPTIKQALQTLEAEKLIAHGHVVKNTGGRNAVSYIAAAKNWFAIGIFLSLHHFICVSVDMNGEILYTKRADCQLDLHDSGYMGQLADMIEQVRVQTGLPEAQLLGVGIAIPSLVGEDGESTVYGMTSDFTGITRKYFEDYIPYPVWIYHDSETAGFAEVWRTESPMNMVYLSLNSSVGSSVYLRGKLYAGDNGRAGELGHMVIDTHSGRRCYCGRVGCFDTLCNTSVLDSYCEGSLPRFFALLAAGDSGAAARWETYTENLALAIHNLKMLFDCTIVIGGYIGAYIGPFLDDLYKKVDARSIFTPFSRTYVFPCKFKTEATAAGAALRVLDQFVNGL